MNREFTPEQIAQTHKAAMDSVNLLNAGQPESVSDADWAGVVRRNVEHLKLVVAWPHMQATDLAPLHTAIASFEA